MQFPNIDWIYIEWYTLDNSNMTSTFATINGNTSVIFFN